MYVNIHHVYQENLLHDSYKLMVIKKSRNILLKSKWEPEVSLEIGQAKINTVYTMLQRQTIKGVWVCYLSSNITHTLCDVTRIQSSKPLHISLETFHLSYYMIWILITFIFDSKLKNTETYIKQYVHIKNLNSCHRWH